MRNMLNYQKSACVIAALFMSLLMGCGAQEETVSTPMPEEQLSSSAASSQEVSSASEDEKPGIGAVYFLPYRQVSLLGTNTLALYAQEEGLVPGEGTLSLHRMKDGALIEKISFADPSHVEMGVLSKEEAEIVGWEGQGSKATVVLSEPILEAGDYYIAMSQDCLKSLDGTISSKALDRGVWDFSIATFGILGGTLQEQDAKVGEVRTIAVSVADEAAKCIISDYDPNQVELLVGELTTSGELQVKFNTAGLCGLDITFQDATGKSVGKINIVTEVQS